MKNPITTNLNGTALGAAVAAELGTGIPEGHEAVRAVLDTIVRALASGHSVTVTNFGTFTPVDRPDRVRRNPQNGAPVNVPASRDARFKVSPGLRTAINGDSPSTATIRKAPKGEAR